jgi:capsular polysaccharide biosynthesis protein
MNHHRSVVSLRHQWEWNYYHFHLDVLGKMKLLSKHGFLDGRPLALGRYVREFPFAADVLRKGQLSKRDWLIPDVDNRRIVLADELIYCRINGLASGDRVRFLLDQMELPPPPLDSRKKIFLNREPPATRVASNFSEIRPLIEERGFTIVDSATLSMDEKIELFSYFPIYVTSSQFMAPA